MPVKITDAIVARTKPVAGRRRVVCDTLVPGLRLRIAETGSKTWAVSYRADGVQRTYKLGSYPILGLAGARDAAKKILAEVQLGGDPGAKRAEPPKPLFTVGDLLDRYVEEWAKPRKKTWTFDAWVAGNLGGLSIDAAEEVKRRDLKLAHEAITKSSGPIQANRFVEVVRAAYNWGLREGLVDCANPAAMIRPNVERSRERVLTEPEILALWREFDREPLVAYEILRLLLVTGQRLGETSALEWAEVSKEGNLSTWTIPGAKTKNGKLHRVPLSDLAVAVLDRMRPHTGATPYVFATPRASSRPFVVNVRKAVERASKASGVVEWTAHDLRRSAATSMASLGVPRFVVHRVLNHADDDVTGIYDRFGYDREKREALDAWAARLRQIVNA